MKKLTSEQTAEIVKLYQDGVQPKELGERFGIRNNSITRIIRKNNIPRTNLVKLSEDVIDSIVKRYAEGVSSEVIAQGLDIDGSTVCRSLKRRGIALRPATENKRTYDINETLFEKIDTEEKAYFLGMLYANGSLSNHGSGVKITLHNKDVDILEKLSNIIYGFRKLHDEKKSRSGEMITYITLGFYSKKMHSDLIKLGCTPTKSFPVEHINNDLMHHFIRGYFDGFGSILIGKTKRPVIDITSNQDFIVGIIKYLEKNIGIKCGKIQQRYKTATTRNFQLTNAIAIKTFIDYIYRDANIYMERKHRKCMDSIKIFANRGKSVKKYDMSKYGTSFIPEFNGVPLLAKNIQNMSLAQIDETAKFVFDFYRKNGFPYPNLTDGEIINDFNALKEANPNCVLEANNMVSSFKPPGVRTFKHFAPQFFEMHPGRRSDKPSMIDVFNDDELFMKVVKNRLNGEFNITGNMIKQGLANSHIAYRGSIFSPMVAKFIYNRYTKDGDVIFDYSMGYGQRLLAAMSLKHNVKYVGVDPFERSVKGNKNIYEFLSSNIAALNKSADIIQCGSENYCDEKYVGKVSMAFSSPPYFNTEMYEDNPAQAGYNGDYTYFINDWWGKTVDNISRLLVDNGHLILNVKKEVGKFDIFEDMKCVALNKGFKQVDLFQMKLLRHNAYRAKNAELKYEPIIVFQK